MQETITNNQHKTHKPPRLATANPHYSVEKLLRETVSVNRFKSRHSQPFQDLEQRCKTRLKGLPSIVSKMNSSKRQLEAALHKNHSKLNISFGDYFRSQMNVNKDLLRRRKVVKLKKVQDQGEKTIEAPPVERDDPAFLETNLKMVPLLNRCFDSLFPAIRYNAALIGTDKQVYLLGGYHQQGFEGLALFHRYDFQGRKWTQVRGIGQIPKISPCFHTVQIYRNHLIILGGVSFEGEKGKRFNTEMLIFNLQKGEWLRTRGGVSLKHHASTLFGSTLMISGGINQKEKFNEDLYFISFGGGNLQTPLIFTVHNNADNFQKLSHHKIVHTYQLDPILRNQIKLDGIYSFGGEDQNGQLNNQLLFINVLGKVGDNLDIKFKKWEGVITNDDKPCPRKDHSFNIINKKALCVLAGGIEQLGNWLSDIWLFDLIRLSWTRINTQPRIEESIGSFAGHCSCVMGSTVYLYNGYAQKKRQKAFWSLQTDSSGYKSKKNMYATKLPSFKSIHSQKQNYSMNQI